MLWRRWKPDLERTWIWRLQHALWSDEDFAYDESNTYNTFFRVKPYEVLNELAENDAIGTIYTTKNSPTLNDYMCTTTLNNVLEDGMDVDEALQDAQDYLDFEW